MFHSNLAGARFDAFFMADHLAVLNMPMEALKRSHTVSSFEPFTLLSALSQHTEHIGLVATASTTFDEPFHIARRFASLDHLSNGRAGWNIVTTSNPDAALNFGREDHMPHDERYARAREFYDVVTGLWDIARPVQGWPVIVQAGASEPGRQLAAETAEVIFAAHGTLQAGQRFYADVKGRLAALGRERDQLKILPAAFVVVGDTQAEPGAPFAPGSTAWCTTTARSHRSRSRSAMTPRSSIPTRRCPRCRRPTRARAAASA